MITTVLFDIDDTLYDQAHPFKVALSRTLPKIMLAEEMSPLYIQFRQYCDAIFADFSAGKIGLKESHYVRINGFHQEITGEKLSLSEADFFQECYEQELAKIALTKEMRTILNQLATQKLNLGIISNGPSQHQWKKVNQLKLLEWFPKERIWLSGDVGIAKPDPEIFRSVQEELAINPSDVLYVGDSFENDIEATGKVGWQSIWFNHRRRPLPEEYYGAEFAKRTAYDVKELADLIEQFVETSLSDEKLFSLKQLTRYRTYLVGTASDFKRKIIAVLDQVFPEYDTVFSKVGIFGKASKEVLLEFSTPDELQAVSAETLANLLAEASRHRLGIEKAEQLKEVAAHSFGVTFAQEAFTFQLRSMIEQLKFLEKQMKEVEQEIKDIMTSLDSVIETIPGIGPINGAAILGEIGDIHKFSNPKKLVAYAGIDASVSQSGQFEATHNVMSKRGSPYLRKALFSAALVASQHDPVLKAFYDKKRGEGKHHLTAIGAVSRKLCYIIHAILTKNEPYEIRL